MARHLISPILFYVLNTNKFNLKILFYSFLPLLTLLINPFGWDVFTHAFETSIISKERLLTEWEPVASKSFPLQSLVVFTTIGIIFKRYSPKKSRPPLWIYFLLMVGVTVLDKRYGSHILWVFGSKGQKTEKKEVCTWKSDSSDYIKSHCSNDFVSLRTKNCRWE